MSHSVLTKLTNFILTITEGEKQIEIVRQVLAEQNLFEPYTAFRRLDQSREGGLRLNDVMDFLSDNNIQPSSDQAHSLFKRLDIDGDGVINYNDFNKAILTRTDMKLRELVSLREGYYIDVNMLLPNEVEWALARLLDTEINISSSVALARSQLANTASQILIFSKMILQHHKGSFFLIFQYFSLQSFMQTQQVRYQLEDTLGFINYLNPNKDEVNYKQLFDYILDEPQQQPLAKKPSSLKGNSQQTQKPEDIQQPNQQFQNNQSYQQLQRPQKHPIHINDNKPKVSAFQYEDHEDPSKQSKQDEQAQRKLDTNQRYDNYPQKSQQFPNQEQQNPNISKQSMKQSQEQTFNPEAYKRQNYDQNQEDRIKGFTSKKQQQPQDNISQTNQSQQKPPQNNLIDTVNREREREIEREIARSYVRTESMDRNQAYYICPYPHYVQIPPLAHYRYASDLIHHNDQIEVEEILRRSRLANLEIETNYLNQEIERQNAHRSREQMSRSIDEYNSQAHGLMRLSRQQQELDALKSENEFLKRSVLEGELKKEQADNRAKQERQNEQKADRIKQERLTKERDTQAQYSKQSQQLKELQLAEDSNLKRLKEESIHLDEILQRRIQDKKQITENLKQMNPEERIAYFDKDGTYPFAIIEKINDYDPLKLSPNKYPKYSDKKNQSSGTKNQQSGSKYTPEKDDQRKVYRMLNVDDNQKGQVQNQHQQEEQTIQ